MTTYQLHVEETSQSFPIPAEIGLDDDLVRRALAGVVPYIDTAVLQREDAAAGHWGVHLRMTGQFLWIDADAANPSPPPCSHTRVQFWNEQGQELRFIDTRSFGQM